MRLWIPCAFALFVAGCGTDEAERDKTLKQNIQEAREAYETCLTIHNNADAESCAPYKAEYENDMAVWKRLHPVGQSGPASQ